MSRNRPSSPRITPQRKRGTISKLNFPSKVGQFNFDRFPSWVRNVNTRTYGKEMDRTRPTLGQSCPCSTNVGPRLPTCRPKSTNLGRFRPISGRLRPLFAKLGPNSGHILAKFTRCRSTLVEFNRMSADLGESWAEIYQFWPKLIKFGRVSGQPCPRFEKSTDRCAKGARKSAPGTYLC